MNLAETTGGTGTAATTGATGTTGGTGGTSGTGSTSATGATDIARAPVPALAAHWDTVREAFPGGGLPPLDDALRGYLSAAGAAVLPLPDHHGARLRLLDLCRNPAAPTAASMGALVTVARAVAHLRAGGGPVTLLAPSSGNAATALRDAVLRAYAHGLAEPDGLGVVCLVPARSRGKLRDSELAGLPGLRRRNPVVVHHGSDPEGVRGLARAYHRERAEVLHRKYGRSLWLTTGLAGDRAAGAVRALLERDLMAPPPPGGRVHAQAVDTGAGLLGHRDGTLLLPGAPGTRPAPRYHLVQHLNTPDLVLRLHFGAFSRAPMPPYAYDAARRLHLQSSDPRFPYAAHSPDEVLEPSFYSRAPRTAGEVAAMVRAGGGGGSVVSSYECLARYPTVRALLRAAGVALPEGPGRLREWALVMTLTGVLDALDRGLLGPGVPGGETEVLVHGTGNWTARDGAPLPGPLMRYADSVDELDVVVAEALEEERP
ncbi:hypothetical protein GCM10009801_33450 [Streptomyces albiaxialis]|uniref:Uncharacterized protein n=1 Tax=Streptomyces albiaxialis TaxID=329523 RepID=A0ABN2VZL0_9ACTN